MKKGSFIVFVFSIVLLSCSSSINIVDKPVVYDKEREQLSIEYMSDRYDLHKETATIKPKMIVVHWTAIPTLEKSFNAFNSSKLPNWRSDIASASALNVSAQFLVDQDGTIYRLMPENKFARHVIGLNHCAIGIENVGGTADKPLTKKQFTANYQLIEYLKEKYPDIGYLIGHLEYTNFENSDLWLEKDDSYRTKKTDPGVDFIENLRKKTLKYNWKSIPEKKNKL